MVGSLLDYSTSSLPPDPTWLISDPKGRQESYMHDLATFPPTLVTGDWSSPFSCLRLGGRRLSARLKRASQTAQAGVRGAISPHFSQMEGSIWQRTERGLDKHYASLYFTKFYPPHANLSGCIRRRPHSSTTQHSIVPATFFAQPLRSSSLETQPDLLLENPHAALQAVPAGLIPPPRPRCLAIRALSFPIPCPFAASSAAA